jgi:Domain of unknown function (DUF927)
MTDYSFLISPDPPPNGKPRKRLVQLTNGDNKVLNSTYANLDDDEQRRRLCKRFAQKEGADWKRLEDVLMPAWLLIVNQAKANPNPTSPTSPTSQRGYQERDKKLCYIYHTKDGEQVMTLCNFVAQITRSEVLDDGSGEDKHLFTVEGTLASGKPLAAAKVPADSFAAMNWPLKVWGLDAVVSAGWGPKDHLRVAIQERSAGAERCRTYKHTGWREFDGVWKYLHSAGAIGPDGTDHSVRIDLGDKLSPFTLPDPPTGDELRRVVQEDLDLLTLAPKFLYPLLGAVYRSVLGPVDCSVSVIGKTGHAKSEVAALVQQHFGSTMDRLNLPGSWTSTANALETLAFLAKDAVCVLDDFKPPLGRYEADQLHAKADRVLRSQGNHSGRGRCNADGTLRPDKPPRGLLISSGEDQFKGESLRARNLPLFFRKGDVDVKKLGPYQKNAAAGVYASSMSGFLCWLSRQYGEVRARLKDEHAELRDKAATSGSHPRVPAIVGDLALGLKYFLDFAVDIGAIDTLRRQELDADSWDALLLAAKEQTAEIVAQDPTLRFLKLVASVINQKKGHLASLNGDAPAEASSWGWEEEQYMTKEGLEYRFTAKGRCLGWVDGDDVYLDPHAAYAAAMALADEEHDSLSITQHQLYRQLKEEGLLAHWEQRKTKTRVMVQGHRKPVLHFLAQTLYPPGKSGGSGAGDEKNDTTDDEETSCGRPT